MEAPLTYCSLKEDRSMSLVPVLFQLSHVIPVSDVNLLVCELTGKSLCCNVSKKTPKTNKDIATSENHQRVMFQVRYDLLLLN